MQNKRTNAGLKKLETLFFLKADQKKIKNMHLNAALCMRLHNLYYHTNLIKETR